MNKQNKNRFIDTEDKLEIMVARWEGVGGEVKGLRSTIGSYEIATGM